MLLPPLPLRVVCVCFLFHLLVIFYLKAQFVGETQIYWACVVKSFGSVLLKLEKCGTLHGLNQKPIMGLFFNSKASVVIVGVRLVLETLVVSDTDRIFCPPVRKSASKSSEELFACQMLKVWVSLVCWEEEDPVAFL